MTTTADLRRVHGVAIIAAEDLLERSLTPAEHDIIEDAVRADTLVDTLVDMSTAGSPVTLPGMVRDAVRDGVSIHLATYDWR